MATITSTTTFVETLRCWGLLDPAQLSELGRTGMQQADPRPLAKHLLQQGWLTPYQINHVLAGRSEELVLGSYHLLERLGEGGMGQVFKARHRKLDRLVALKVIRRDRLSNEETVRRFRREIQAVAQLAHPNIVLAFDADEVGGTHFFAMEYVEGVNLAQHVKRNGPMPYARACECIRQAALGLEHIHQHGLVHRDIKPSNLLVSPAPGAESRSPGSSSDLSLATRDAGIIKILDLGLARLEMAESSSDHSDTLTRNGVLMGTPDFIAAEQASNPHEADIRSDLYSLGCTLYFLLAGRVPFPGGSAVDKLFRHRLEDPEPLANVCPPMPAEVDTIVRRLMAKDPHDRFQTPAELAEALTPLTIPGQHALDRNGSANTLRDAFTFDSMLTDSQLPPTPREEPAGPPAAVSAPKRGRPFPWRVRPILAAGLLGVALLASIGAILMLSSFGGEPRGEPAVQTSAPAPQRRYVRGATRNETILATLRANGLPTLEGKWYYIGPFDYGFHNGHGPGFKHAYPPEREFDLTRTYKGKHDKSVAWKELAGFRPGEMVDLRRFEDNDNGCVYLYHEFDVMEPSTLVLSLGSDDTLSVWHNQQLLLAKEMMRAAAPDQDRVALTLKPGKNQLLLKVCNVNNIWAFHAMPQWPANLDKAFGDSLRRDFPVKGGK
ncbi:MAG: protein kinase [Gemmataceae bacterium]|nr:protein kinase [Gemmataceae bacterium]